MKTKFEFKVEKGKLYKREVPKDIRKNAGNCPFCDLPVYVSSGQLLTYRNDKPTHRTCRKNNT